MLEDILKEIAQKRYEIFVLKMRLNSQYGMSSNSNFSQDIYDKRNILFKEVKLLVKKKSRLQKLERIIEDED